MLKVEDYIVWHKNDIVLTTFEKVVLTLEDRRFLQHGGVDWIAGCREVIKYVLRRKHGGASTIDMQFVRTATGYRELTLRRKLYEILLSLLIQYRYPKIQILRSYLDCAFFGSGLIGIERTSRALYEKRPSELSNIEAGRIAAMLVYPKPLVPKGPWYGRVERRAEYGLRRMARFEEFFKKIPSGE